MKLSVVTIIYSFTPQTILCTQSLQMIVVDAEDITRNTIDIFFPPFPMEYITSVEEKM